MARALSEVEAKKVQTLILLGGVFTTLAVWTNLEDPINLPKMFILMIFGAVVLGLSLPALFSAIKLDSILPRIGLVIVGLFSFGLLVSTYKTDVKYVAWFGEYHRNNGALSYLSMSALMLGSIFAFNLRSVARYFNFFSVTGFILAAYGILQGIEKDPVSWVIQYNPFVTTLGNPNFTSALLGISGISTVFLILTSKNKNLKAVLLVGLLLEIYILLKTGSIQGLFGFVIGSSVIVLTKLWIMNKRFAWISIGLATVISVPILLALFNVGPFASRIYQGTLRNRFDYWSAAFAMFKDHVLFGVGIDRFGEYYREYALQNQVVQGQVTDNAHSVYMQLLATGGILTFIPYALLVIFVTYIGISALLKSSASEKLQVSGILAIWLATVAINLITVDSLGVGIWFWITGGILIAISRSKLNVSENGKIKSNKKDRPDSEIFPSGYFAAAVFLIFSLIISVPQISKSGNLLTLKKTLPGLSSQDYISQVIDAFDPAEQNPQFLIQLSDLAFRQGAIVDGLKMVDRVNEIDPRSYYGNYFAAIANESSGKKSEAIKYRERLKVLDPWNNASLLELVKDYLSVGDKAAAEEIAALIKRNYPGSQPDIDASALLVG